VKRHNVLIYGMNNDPLQWQMFNILCAEHRCFMKDRLMTPWGASALDRELSKHPSITKSLYAQVELVLITKVDDHYFNELMNEISKLDTNIKVIVLDKEASDITHEAIENNPEVSISYCGLKSPRSPEEIYFYDEPMDIIGDKEFWTGFFKHSLFEVEIV